MAEAVLEFEFVVEGPAVSLRAKDKNARHYQRWIQTVRAAAQVRWPSGTQPVIAPVTVTISNYFMEPPPDIDNIIKPILDAMNGVVYVDDEQVYRVTSQKIDKQRGRSLDTSEVLADALTRLDEVLNVVVQWENGE